VRARGAGIEAAARAHLCRAGLRPIAANATARVGELDLVMRDGDTVVFVEVRYRRSARFGDGAASIDARKRRRLVLAARQFLARRRDLQDAPCRFDVVDASGDPDAPTLRWLRDAFRADD
jgi:putative endonuclease